MEIQNCKDSTVRKARTLVTLDTIKTTGASSNKAARFLYYNLTHLKRGLILSLA